MKLRNLFLGVCSALAVFAACEQNENLGAASISLSTDEVTFDADGGDQAITLKATRDWSVGEVPEWVAVSPEDGLASGDSQTVTVTVLKNDGYDRSADIKFAAGPKSKYLTVYQAGPLGSADALIIYSNNFDISKAQNNSGWPYLDKNYDLWDNKTGSGAEAVEYEFGGKMSVRTSGKASNDNSGYSHYAGSGSNKIFFGTATSTLKINKITLDGKSVNYTLTYGGQKYLQDGDSKFSFDEFKVYVSSDFQKWVELNDAFPEDSDIDGDWNLATANFTVPAGTTQLGIAFVSTCSSAYSIDDVNLVVGTQEGQVIDFARGVELSGTTAGSGSGSGSTEDLPEGTGEGTQASPYNAAKAQRLASALGSEDKVTGVYVTGTVKEIKELSTQYGNATYWITDEDGIAKFYVYRGKNLDNSLFTSADQLKVGDKVVIFGDLMNYMGDSPQLGQGNYLISNSSTGTGGGGTTEPSTPVEQPTTLVKATIAQFLAAAEDDTWYELTGEIVSIVAGNKYGNFTIKDETGSVYIYGMTSKWVGSNDQSFETLGLKVTDVVTLGTRRTSNPNNGVAQGGGNTVPAYYISHVAGAGVPEDPAGTVELTFPSGNKSSVNNYTTTWTVQLGSNTWSIANFNNNQNKWSYIKCGRKSDASVATISTTNAYASAINKVVVSIDQLIDASKVQAKLEVASDAAFSTISETVNVDLFAGNVEFVITSPKANHYYRLTFDDASNGKSNGNVQISKVRYVPAN